RAEAESEYAGDLRRLLLELRQVREQPPEVSVDSYEAEVRRAGEAIGKLEEHLHALRPKADTDRFFYTDDQILKRLELYQPGQRSRNPRRPWRLRRLRRCPWRRGQARSRWRRP